MTSLMFLWSRKTKRRFHIFRLVTGSFLFPDRCSMAEREDVCLVDRMYVSCNHRAVFIVHTRKPHFSAHH